MLSMLSSVGSICIPLPKAWPRRVRSAVVHVVAMAHPGPIVDSLIGKRGCTLFSLGQIIGVDGGRSSTRAKG
jgi:hypothetical protein